MAWKGLGNVNALLNQLQGIEESLTNLMMETIMKMQTLTETKVFLLLEDPHTKRRRYCGDKELIENFERSSFKNTPHCDQDVELRLDPAVEILMERPKGKKRASADNGDETENSPSKRPMLDTFEDRDENGEIKVIKSELCSDDETGEPTVFEGYVSGHASLALNNENPDDYDSAGDDDQDADYEPADPAEGKGTGTASRPNQSNYRRGSYETTNDEKIKELKNLRNPVLCFHKATRENKLLNSVMYQFGKQLAISCPYEDPDHHAKEVREYLKTNMNRHLQKFPRITKLKKRDVPEGAAKKVGPISYMKNMIRTGFRSYAPQFFKYYNRKARKDPGFC